ncbi:His-Xaa-Ser system protein HxsD [Prevotella lacticifex]|jgi:His-Xaa-Ser system protein HxsD|uniref:His-Xaa-Ser system protein HxsD n=1 Tax=Prevotella lacticifex TaxID=2854755 RepID=A0A9R1C7E1_9BACT|nr:His-Xaa-Ser system protein HxsD [Prevotella lacticifex]GJG37129.1 hypothetical protein PRLR5003_22860 [Prevotella lacticifex]GJG40371.1 hypothetical protein PRLR5019_23420 [Prevotella lacticifex]GJG44068.1 hypothetical protein PRLR5025_28540 [Prevotella lacticifex]GJG46752.1 hypothetical protein PRLR5027_23470 [Prevotella lacticifex]GJG50628.1 hypothetical protein PRLR5052_30410 [Prevotella lacticifex]
MNLEVNRDIYSDSVISKVVYWLSGNYAVERKLNGNTEIMNITSIKDEPIDEKTLHHKVFQMLNDQKLRNIIEDETNDIRTILFAKAFADFDDLTEEDLTE